MPILLRKVDRDRGGAAGREGERKRVNFLSQKQRLTVMAARFHGYGCKVRPLSLHAREHSFIHMLCVFFSNSIFLLRFYNQSPSCYLYVVPNSAANSFLSGVCSALEVSSFPPSKPLSLPIFSPSFLSLLSRRLTSRPLAWACRACWGR
jgi:hypothetical protein